MFTVVCLYRGPSQSFSRSARRKSSVAEYNERRKSIVNERRKSIANERRKSIVSERRKSIVMERRRMSVMSTRSNVSAESEEAAAPGILSHLKCVTLIVLTF